MRAGACSGNASCPPDKPTCDGGVCHNRYACTAAQDVCSGRGARHCPNNAKGYCVGANGGQFCHTEDVPHCLFPGQTCCDCPSGYDCVTLNGPGCCFGQGSLVCLKPAPPP